MRCGLFKDIIIKTKLKIKTIDIIIGGCIVETIDYKFLKIYNYLLNKKDKSFKNYLYEYYFDFEKKIIIPSFIFNYGLIRLDFHHINLNITFNDNIVNENDIDIYVNHYNIDVFTYINYCSLTYDIPYKEIVKVNKTFEETIALIFETPKPNSIKIGKYYIQYGKFEDQKLDEPVLQIVDNIFRVYKGMAGRKYLFC